MLSRLPLAAALALGLSSAASAQVADVVQVCGAASGTVTPVGQGGHLTRDVNGNTCVAISAGASAAPGGISTLSRIPSSSAGNNLTLAKSSAGRAYTYQGCNTTASTVYMRIYNAASTGAVTPGTTPVYAGPYAFPANTCIQATSFSTDLGLYASTGLVYVFGTAPVDSDTTTIGAGAIAAFQIGLQ